MFTTAAEDTTKTPKSTWDSILQSKVWLHYSEDSSKGGFSHQGRAYIIEPGAVTGALLPNPALAYDARNQATYPSDTFSKNFRKGFGKEEERWYHPVVLSMLRLHKYSTLGARYGFNHVAYLGDLTVSEGTAPNGVPVFEPKNSPPDDAGWRGFRNHFRTAFAHGNLANDVESAFAPGVILVAVEVVARTTRLDNDDNDDGGDDLSTRLTYYVDGNDSYHYAMEQVLLELQSPTPRRIVFHYQYFVCGKMAKDSTGTYMQRFLKRLNDHVQSNLGVSKETKDILIIEARPLGSSIRDQSEDTTYTARTMDKITDMFRGMWITKKVTEYLPSSADVKQIYILFQAMALVDEMMMNPTKLARNPQYLEEAAKQTRLLQARSAEAYVNASDIYMPLELTDNAPLVPIWPAPIPASIGITLGDKQEDGIAWSYREQATALLGEYGLCSWKVWMPPQAMRFQYKHPSQNSKSPVKFLTKWEKPTNGVDDSELRWNFENRASLTGIIKHYLTWLFVDPPTRLDRALQTVHDIRSRESLKQVLSSYFGPNGDGSRRQTFSLVIGHFVAFSKFEEELLKVIAELIGFIKEPTAADESEPSQSKREEYFAGIEANEKQAKRQGTMLSDRYGEKWTVQVDSAIRRALYETEDNQLKYREEVLNVISAVLKKSPT